MKRHSEASFNKLLIAAGGTGSVGADAAAAADAAA